MKKILGLLFISSSLFSMQLAHKLQGQYNHSNLSRAHLVKIYKSHAPHTTISNPIDEKKLRIDPSSVHTPHRLSDVELYHSKKKGFVVLHDDKKHVIEKAFMDPIARSITKEQLKYFLNTGYFAINQTNDGTFTLKAHHRLLGGGPIFGAFMYWLTKSVCYGTAAVAVGTIAVGTGGAAVAVGTHVAAAGAGMAVASTIAAPAAIVTTAGVGVASAGTVGIVAGTGATLTAAAMTGAGAAGVTVAGVSVTTAATLTTAAGVTAVSTTGAAATVGTGAACVMGIEALSTAVGTFFGMLPTP